MLRSFIENSYELGETADAVIWNYLNVLDTFLSDTYDKVNAQICMQIAVIRAKLEGIVGEKAAQLEAKLAELEAKLEKLITMLNKGIGDVKALVSEIEKLIAEIKALAELLDGIDIGACLNKIAYAVEFIYSMNSDELKSALNELALDLFDRAMESLKESAPYIDEKLYEYFYNNPEQIIDFFKTYGPEIEKYADKYSDKILSVFGYVLYEYGYDALVYFIENPEETLGNISLWYDEYGVRIWPLVQVYIDALGIDYYTLEGIDVDFEDVVERLYALIVRIDSDLTELIVKLEVLGVKLNEGAARALELIAEIKSKIEYLVTVGRDHAEATLDEIKMMAELINTYSSELQLAIKEIIDNTVNGEYTPDEDSYYVAIAGDNNGYAELVAGAMGLGDKYVVMNWNNIDYSILEGADFVTIGYDATAVSGFAIDQLLAALAAYGNESLKGQIVDYLNSAFADNLSEEQIAEYTSLVVNAMDTVLEHPAFAGGQTVTMDWASLVGAENVAEIEALLAEVKALLEEKGIDGNVVVPINVAELVDKYVPQNGFAITVFDNKPVFELSVPAADLIMLAVESYLYANISFQMSYATLIGELVAINPDVQIAVLGQYNPFCDLTIEGITIPVSEIYESLVNVRSAVSFVYALGLSNVTYIDISNVEAEWITVENPADILDAYADNELNASFTDAGNLYVMYQILNAYSLSCQHVYDGCEDVDCNICGVIRESSKHNYVAVVIKPDCENGGYTAYTCSDCGDSYVDDEVAALGHAYDNDCDADCNRCGEKRTPADHKFGDWKTTVPATEDTAGERARTCLVCGYVETEIISPTPIEPIGVGAVVAIVIGSLVCVSGITAAVLLILKKRKIS